MKGIATEMKFLCENILHSDEDRKNEIEQIKEQAEAIRDNARKFLSASYKFQKEMGKELRTGLREGKEELIKKVNAFREDFNKKEKEVKADLAEASRLWNEMHKVLRDKRAKHLQAAGR